MTVKTILVPIDFSAGGQQALDYAVDLFAKEGARIIVLHVLEPLYFATPADLYGGPANATVVLDEQKRAAQEQLGKIVQRLAKRRLRVESVLRTGVPYQTILATADERKVDVIAMATHGRTGFSHLLLGSVTEKVVRSARCPVLTVRASATKRRSARPTAKRLSKRTRASGRSKASARP